MIELCDLTKSFRTVHGRHYVFRHLSLTFPDGANIGLIGPNGAGKSTLMRIIGGIDVPDCGSVVTDRRISFPVGLSGGFQGTLSGRDNAKFVCRLYGVSAKEVRDKVRFVEEFAELGKYFDMPIKTYSSGMRSRLIFGLSMAFDFDYYLMDEVGAVGDAGFKEKSRELLQTRIGSANVICVSHNMSVIREQCNLVVLLRGGEATLYTDLEEGIRAYQGDAYVDPEAPRRRRGKPLNRETITARDIRKARRVLRVVRRARRERIAASPQGSETASDGVNASHSDTLSLPVPRAGQGRRGGNRGGRNRRSTPGLPLAASTDGPSAAASKAAKRPGVRRRAAVHAGDSGMKSAPATDLVADGPILPSSDGVTACLPGAEHPQERTANTPAARREARRRARTKGQAGPAAGSRPVPAAETVASRVPGRESLTVPDARAD